MRLYLENNMSDTNINMNRRQQPPPPRPPTQQRQQQQQSSGRPMSSPTPTYNPNSANKQLPPQVTIPQAISILVARINQLEDKCAMPQMSQVSEQTQVDQKQMEEMASRIVKLEMDLLTAKDHIMRLQSITLLNVAKPSLVDADAF
jgi:hypothetical protein